MRGLGFCGSRKVCILVLCLLPNLPEENCKAHTVL